MTEVLPLAYRYLRDNLLVRDGELVVHEVGA